MTQKYKNNIWYSFDGLTSLELEDLDLIEMLALNRIIVDQQRIFQVFPQIPGYPQILFYLPVSLN